MRPALDEFMNILLTYNIILIFSMILLCTIASFTDFKFGKVFNKHLLIFLAIGLLVNIMYISYALIAKQIDFQICMRYALNIIIGAIISYFMYYNKIWAAGDAKMYFVILFLVPYNLLIYKSINIFPGFILLSLIFSIGFIFLIGETLFQLAKDITHKIKSRNKRLFLNTNMVFSSNIIWKYLFSYFLSATIIELFTHFLTEFYSNNRGFLLLVNVLLISITLNALKNKKFTFWTIALGIFYLLIKILVIPISKNSFYIGINSIFTLIIVIFLRYLGSKYNYSEIPVDNAKAGMVLSFDTVLNFKKSKIKGLPEITTETTKTRLTKEQAESIKKWGETKSSTSTIRIVKHIPFAPFISFGALAFTILRFVLTFINKDGL